MLNVYAFTLSGRKRIADVSWRVSSVSLDS